MWDLVGWLENYTRSPDAIWHLACLVVSLFNQVAVVRYVVWILTKSSLGLWQVRGALAMLALAVDELLIDSGFGVELGLLMFVVFCFDAIFLRFGNPNY